jgi:hypothetical protein
MLYHPSFLFRQGALIYSLQNCIFVRFTKSQVHTHNIRFKKSQAFKTSGCKTSSFKTSLLVNIIKCPFSKKNIDLTFVMLNKVGSKAYGPNNITLCWVRSGQEHNIHIYSVLVNGGDLQVQLKPCLQAVVETEAFISMDVLKLDILKPHVLKPDI